LNIGDNNGRRFPSPWAAEETDTCFIVRDHNGQALAYVYFEDEPGRRTALPTNSHAMRRGGLAPTLPSCIKQQKRRVPHPEKAAGALSI
jgi:hypothetical protein